MKDYPRTDSLTLVTILVIVGISLSGCTVKPLAKGGGQLAIRSQAELHNILKGGFETGIYSYDDKNDVTVVLFDGPLENPTQAVTIRVFWQPCAGQTPIDQTATNATVHYLIFTGAETRQAGVYSGAGYVYPDDYPGSKIFHGSVWEADLLLQDSSDGFKDLLGQARLSGRFSARRDDAQVLASVRRLNIMVRERLGYPRFVRAEDVRQSGQ